MFGTLTTGLLAGVMSVVVGVVATELRNVAPFGNNIVGTFAYADALIIITLMLLAYLAKEGRLKTILSVTTGVFIVFEVYENLFVSGV